MKKYLLFIATIPFCTCITAQGGWTQKANFAGVARIEGVGFSIGNKGYIGLGQDNSSNKKNDFWEYDPANNTWYQKADSLMIFLKTVS